MKFGLLKDIKPGEYRTIVTPAEVEAIVRDGHEVYVQRGAGAGAGFADEQYAREGAKLVDTMEEIYGTCDFVTKVKELEPCEFPLLRENQIVLTCIHPAAHPQEVQALLDSKCIAFTAEDAHRYGSPNCEAAGKLGALMGLDGMILLAFILGFPANEIVIPLVLMGYLSAGSLVELNHLTDLAQLLNANGWTPVTAVCFILFSLFHWPCSTTCLTIHKETGSWKWTIFGMIFPTLFGIVLCFAVHMVATYGFLIG